MIKLLSALAGWLGENWGRIDYGRRKGWYMMAKYLEVSG